MSRGDDSGAGDRWRRKAEEHLEALGESPEGALESVELAKSMHELLVQQVELELQNEELIEARAELETHAELLTELYDFAPVGYFSLSANGLIRQLNFMGGRMLGRERSLLLGKSFVDFIHPQNRKGFERFLSWVFAGETSESCEVTLRRHGQSAVIASLTGALSSSGLICRMAAMDVTEQRRVEAAAKEKNEDLERIFNMSHDLLGIAGADGRFRRINPAFERILGYSSEVLTGCDFLRFVHPEDRAASVLEMDRLRAGEEVTDFVNRYRCKDGSYRWLEWRVSPYGDQLQCAVARDITERKETEDALRRSEEKFRSIVESSPTAMYLYHLDGEGRLILMEANPAADKELGIKHGKLIGKTLEEAFPKLAGTGVVETFKAVAGGTRGTQSFEIGYDGGGISGYFDVTVFLAHPGTIAVFFADISESRNAREELETRVQQRTAELQERTLQLRALADELTVAEERERRRIAGLIHEDLQQMLVAALLNLGMLKSKIDHAAEAKDLAQIENILRDSIKAARSLTSDLSPPVLQQCGLPAAIKWLRTWCGEKYGMDVRVEVQDDADPGTELGVTMFRCVRELLFNIVKHAGVRSAGLRMWRTCEDVVNIEVSDAGSGFDPEEVRAREGSGGGFGLFSIRERMEWLGGGFEIESAPGAGSRCTLRVPLRIAPHADGAAHSSTGSARGTADGGAGSDGVISGA